MARNAGKRSSKHPLPPQQHLPLLPPTQAHQLHSDMFLHPCKPLASTLPTNHVYLIHLDRTPIDLKRRRLHVPVLLNLSIVLGLCLRIYFAAPVYFEQIITIFGYDTAYSIDPKSRRMGDLMNIVSSRFILIFIDYALFALLGSWPKEFLFGSKSSRFVGPWQWRQKVWFERPR